MLSVNSAEAWSADATTLNLPGGNEAGLMPHGMGGEEKQRAGAGARGAVTGEE